MKKSKKLLSMMLALALTATMVTGIGAISASAQEATEEQPAPTPVACTTCNTDGVNYDDNGFCEHVEDTTHYQAATLNNNGTESDTADDYYEIGNAGQLYWFADQINTKAIANTSNAKLTANIVVNTGVLDEMAKETPDASGFREWMPIGWYKSASDTLAYSGTFDGNNNTISGLYIVNSNYIALFSRAENATIKNLGLLDGYVKGAAHVGGLVGTIYGDSTIENCYNANTVVGTEQHIGGLVGYVDGNLFTMTKSYNQGLVTGNKYVGGLVGTTKGQKAVISNSYNKGSITASGETASNAGGLIGYIYSFQSSNETEITKSYNVGDVTAKWQAGGLVAHMDKATITITHSYNTGNATSTTKNVGGLIAYVAYKCEINIANSYNTGDVTSGDNAAGLVGFMFDNTKLTVHNAYNTGSVSAEKYYSMSILLKNEIESKDIKNVFYLSDELVDDGTDNATAVTAAQFASGEIGLLMNENQEDGATVWYQNLGEDALPTLDSTKNAVTSSRVIAYIQAQLEAKDAELAQADADNKAALEQAIAEAKAALEAKDAELTKANADNKAALEAKDASQQTFIIIVCVIAGLAFAGCGTLGVLFFLDKKKKA